MSDDAPKKIRHTVKVAVHVMLVRDGRVFMIRRQNTGFQDGRWSLPSGHLEEGETVLEGAAREVEEEAGVVIAPRSLALHTVVHARSPGHEYVHMLFTTDTWQGEPRSAEPDKGSEIAWLPLDALPDDTIVYERRAIEADRGSVICLGYD